MRWFVLDLGWFYETPLDCLVALLQQRTAGLKQLLLGRAQRGYLGLERNRAQGLQTRREQLTQYVTLLFRAVFNRVFLTLDQLELIVSSPHEERVGEFIYRFRTALDLDERVKIKLPQERAIIAMPEVLGEKSRTELVGLAHHEGTLALGPADHRSIFRGFEDLREFQDEGWWLQGSFLFLCLHYKYQWTYYLQATTILRILEGAITKDLHFCGVCSVSTSWCESSALQTRNRLQKNQQGLFNRGRGGEWGASPEGHRLASRVWAWSGVWGTNLMYRSSRISNIRIVIAYRWVSSSSFFSQSVAVPVLPWAVR